MNGVSYVRPAILDKIGLGTHRVIEANAGTGKTFTLEHLIVELLVRGKVPLDQILAVTFTQRATAELRARVRAAIDRALRAAYAGDEAIKTAFPGSIDLVAPLEAALFSFERAPIHTIHSFCQRVLTELAFATGARFGIETADGRALFHEAFRAVLRENKIAGSEYAGPLKNWIADSGKSVDDLEKMLFEVNSKRYEPGVGGPASSIETRLADLFVPPMRTWLQTEKFRRGVIDYDDMLERVHLALVNDTDGRLAATLRERYRFALIDEFQDTDEIQWAIFRKIFVAGETQGAALYLIGDPKQAIYSFRGADVHAYLRARADIAAPPNDPIALVENFRSTPGDDRRDQSDFGSNREAAVVQRLDQVSEPGILRARRFARQGRWQRLGPHHADCGDTRREIQRRGAQADARAPDRCDDPDDRERSRLGDLRH